MLQERLQPRSHVGFSLLTSDMGEIDERKWPILLAKFLAVYEFSPNI